MAATQTITVPHLGGIKAGYAFAKDHYDPSKPTCVLINSMCMTVSLYHDQFIDGALNDAMNLLAIEPLGHGSTSSPSEHFTYWDSAHMALQVLDHFGIQKAFALGTSQGGWVVARMALLAPDRVSPSSCMHCRIQAQIRLISRASRSSVSCLSEHPWIMNPRILGLRAVGILPPISWHFTRSGPPPRLRLTLLWMMSGVGWSAELALGLLAQPRNLPSGLKP